MAKDAGGHGSNRHDPSERFKAGDRAHFSGSSPDGKMTGSVPVSIVDPWSNKHKVTGRDSRGRPLEGGSVHLPTASVEHDRSKRGLPNMQFEAYHHQLGNAGG